MFLLFFFMIITIYNRQRDLALTTAPLKKAIPLLLKHLSIETKEVIIHFVSEKAIRQLHLDFFNDPSSTDCISFPLDPPTEKQNTHHIIGEIFVCPKTALLYCQDKQIDPYFETLLYIVHGLLHLIGYDDLSLQDRKIMRHMEKKCLAFLQSTTFLHLSFLIKKNKKKLS